MTALIGNYRKRSWNAKRTFVNGLNQAVKYCILIGLLLASIQKNPFAQQPVIDSLEAILTTAKTDTAKVNILNLLGSQYINISNYEMARQFADSALNQADRIRYDKGKIKAYNSLGRICLNQGDYQEAMDHSLALLKLSEETGEKKGMAHAYLNIGVINSYQGNYPEALKSFHSSLKIFEEIDYKKGMAYTYNNIGLLFMDQGNFDEAIKNLFASLEIKQEIGDKRGMAATYENIGLIYDDQGNYPAALENYFSSLKIKKEFGEKAGIAASYTNIGVTYSNQGDFPKALEYTEAALEICLEIGNDNEIATNYLSLANLNIEFSNFSEARKYLEESLALSKKIGSKYNIHLSYYYLARLESVEGNFDQAFNHFRMYDLYKDSLISEESQYQLAQMQIQYETEKKDREIELLNKDKALKEEQLEKQRLLLNGVIAGTALILIVGLLLFRSFRLRKKLEHQQATIEERNRISADLHDDIGSGLSRIMLQSEMVKKVARSPETRKGVEKIANISIELSSNISEIIWALNSNNDSAEDLVAYIRRYAAEYFENAPVRLKISTPSKMEHRHISGEHRRNLFFAVKEALHNILKHAQATEATLKFKLKQDVLTVVISDNGTGIKEEAMNRFGNGLNNMRRRLESINGNCLIENQKGTRITLVLPV